MISLNSSFWSVIIVFLLTIDLYFFILDSSWFISRISRHIGQVNCRSTQSFRHSEWKTWAGLHFSYITLSPGMFSSFCLALKSTRQIEQLWQFWAISILYSIIFYFTSSHTSFPKEISLCFLRTGEFSRS